MLLSDPMPKNIIGRAFGGSMRKYLATAMVATMTTAASANLVSNGSFEAAPANGAQFWSTGVAPSGEVQDYYGNHFTNAQFVAGWTLADPGTANLFRTPYLWSYAPTLASQGQQYLSLNWSPLGGIQLYNTVSQNFSLGAGATGIALSMAMSVESGFDGSTLTAQVLDRAGSVVTSSQAFTHAGIPWETKRWTTDLAPGSYTLRFVGVGNGNAWDVLLDDVQLNAIGGAVPEPASWALMIGGFGAIGASLRRSRRLQPARS